MGAKGGLIPQKTERLPKTPRGVSPQPAAKPNRQLRKLPGSQNHKGERGIPSTIDGFSLNPQKTGKTPSMGEEGASFHQNGTMNPVGQFTLYQNVLQVLFGENDRNENPPQMGNLKKTLP